MRALVKTPLRSTVRETDRVFVGNAGLNYEAAWHIICVMLDRVGAGGANANKPAPLEGVQSTLVPPGEATMAELKGEMPGTYISVDHSIFRTDKGALGLLKRDGPTNPSIFKAL